MELYLKIAGILLILLAFIHISFPKYFNWKGELSTLSIINRQMMYFHMFFIALVVFLMGLLCLTSSKELLTSALGKRISLGLGIFWIVRLIVQFVGYSSKTWKGKPFETYMHVLFSALWVFISSVFILTYIA
jgi:hypothetical protein